MKIKIFIGIVVLLFVLGIVVAGIGLNNTDSSININPEKETNIKTELNIKDISIESSPIKCDEEVCYSKLKQDGLIDKLWSHAKKYCTKYNHTKEEIILPTGEKDEIIRSYCLEYTDYELNKIIEARNKYIVEILEKYSNTIDDRKKTEILSSGGKITA